MKKKVHEEKGRHYVGNLLLILAYMILLQGCNGAVKYYARPDFDIRNIGRIAVLPMVNHSNQRFADEKMTRVVITELLSRGIAVIEPGEVRKVLRDLRIRDLSAVSTENAQEIGKKMNVEAIVKGSVSSFGTGRGVSVSYPEASVHLMLIDTNSGDILWSIWHTEGGPTFWSRHFGAEGMTPDETAMKVVKEAFNTLF